MSNKDQKVIKQYFSLSKLEEMFQQLNVGLPMPGGVNDDT